MDAFYASVEQRDDPALRGKPVIVGAPPTQRGVVCASSYEARKFGVRPALPSATARRLCPQGIFVRPRMDHYREESRHIMQIIGGTGAVRPPQWNVAAVVRVLQTKTKLHLTEMVHRHNVPCRDIFAQVAPILAVPCGCSR